VLVEVQALLLCFFCWPKSIKKIDFFVKNNFKIKKPFGKKI
jgi:hypothetical protein